MTSRRSDRIDELFDRAVELPPEERDIWLAEHGSDDDRVLTEVRSLLAAHDRAAGILETPPVARAATDRRIGPYRVQRELGRGGMGVVYLAERADGQYRRRVAVKLLRASPDADELQRRFLAERQILASLDHPNIAQLLDGGITDGQLPYIVMEYVEGLPITTYCDRQGLGLDERLRLFLDVCAAVRHAHQNLVVHRDLKPGNIFVTADGRVKLLDFGIAKLLNPELADVAQPVTRTEFRLMTPEYASPEQIRGEPLSTASDVYSLGVVLYELLTGRRPYDLGTGSPAELATAVCERDPDKPSSRAAAAPEDDDRHGADRAVAAARGTTPEKLRRTLQGDLDAIVMMTLRKAPRQRYGTAERLARDIERYLEGRPVLAHRGSRIYRLRRFAARHRRSVGSAVVVTLSLLSGTGLALWQAAAARAERDRAAVALAESEEVTGFLVGLFEAGDPLERGGGELTVRDLLQRAARHAEDLHAQPRVQARLLEAMGRVYGNLSDTEPSRRLLEHALVIRERTLDSTHADVVSTLYHLTQTLIRQRQYPEAESLARRALRLKRLGGDEGQPDEAALLHQLAGLAVYRADLSGADSLSVEALAIRRARHGDDHHLVADALERIAATRRRLGRSDDSEAFLREAIAIEERSDSASLTAAGYALRLGDVLSQDRGRHAEADSLYRVALGRTTTRLGAGHLRTILASNDYGAFLMRRGRAAEADSIFRANLEGFRRLLGTNHPRTGWQLAAIAAAASIQGHHARAESLYLEALPRLEADHGRGSNAYTSTLTAFGRALIAAGRIGDADSIMQEAVTIRRIEMGEHDTPLFALTLAALGEARSASGAFTEAESLYIEADRLLRRYTGPEHRDVRRLHASRAALYERWGRASDAATHRRLAGNDVPPY